MKHRITHQRDGLPARRLQGTSQVFSNDTRPARAEGPATDVDAPKRRRLRAAVLAILLALFHCTAAQAQRHTVVISFDNLPSGTILSRQYLNNNPFSPTYPAGVYFDNKVSPGSWLGHVPIIFTPGVNNLKAYSPPNDVLIGDLVNVSYLHGTFTVPSQFVSVWVLGADGNGIPITLSAYDSAGYLIGQQQQTLQTNLGHPWQFLSVSASPNSPVIAKLRDSVLCYRCCD